MAGMRALGRVYDVVAPTAAATAVTVCLKDCSAVGIVAAVGATATGTLTFTASTSFAGTYVPVQPSSGFGNPNTWYLRSAAGTVAWAPQAASWAAGVLTISSTSGANCYVDFLVSELADTYDYLKVLPGAAVTATAMLYDLTVMRTPANLRIPSA